MQAPGETALGRKESCAGGEWEENGPCRLDGMGFSVRPRRRGANAGHPGAWPPERKSGFGNIHIVTPQHHCLRVMHFASGPLSGHS